MNITFCSTLPPSYHRTLERLVFFNRHQGHARAAIAEAIALYGKPAIVLGPKGVHVTLESQHESQCLFALTRRQGHSILLGMALYARPTASQLVVVHLALAGVLSKGSPGAYVVAMGLVRQVRAIADRVRGISSVRLLYTGRELSRPTAVEFQRDISRPGLNCSETSGTIPNHLAFLPPPRTVG